MNVLYRNSSNRVEVVDLVDKHEHLANPTGVGAPTPVVSGVTVTAQLYAPDQTTSLGVAVPLLQEPDQVQNYYRGVFPDTINLGPYDEVWIKFFIDGGGPTARRTMWELVKVEE